MGDGGEGGGCDLTREALMAELAKVQSWTGGGMHGPTNPGARSSTQCFLMLKVSPDGFTRVYPRRDEDHAVYDNPVIEGMDCAPENRITLTNPPTL